MNISHVYRENLYLGWADNALKLFHFPVGIMLKRMISTHNFLLKMNESKIEKVPRDVRRA